MAKRKLRTNMVLSLWGTSALIFIALLVVQFLINKGQMEKDLRGNAITLAEYYGERLGSSFAAAQMIPIMEAARMESSTHWENATDIKGYLRRSVEMNPSIYGSAIAFEPNARLGILEPFSPYYYRSEGELEYKDLADKDYRYLEWKWFRQAKALGRPLWTEAYYDTGGGNVFMITYSHPFYRGKEFAGVATVDVSLEKILRDISDLKVLETGYGFMLDAKGHFVTFPYGKELPRESITTMVPTLTEEMDSLSGVPSGKWIFTEDLDPVRKEASWIILTPIREDSVMVGTVAFVYPAKEILSSIISLEVNTFFIGTVGLIVLLGVIVFVANSITRPIAGLSEAVDEAAKGKLDLRIDVSARSSEVLTLQNGFNKMLSDLKLYIKNLKEETARNERIESELKIAHQIQASMLPRIFPPFPDRKDMDLFAVMDPAKEVGGDFYDFFLIGENRLCIVVGDVSGKGVPAALFMMINKVLLKNEGLSGTSPDQVLFKVNNIISEDNEELMFVTIFYAILDLATGELQYANAGHNPPLIGSAGSAFEYIKPDKNFVLGVKPDSNFALDRIKLNPGDTFFMYTDGVTEAMDPGAKLFGEPRLQNSLNASRGQSVTSTIQNVKKDITDFAQGAEQSDDITMLAVKYIGRG